MNIPDNFLTPDDLDFIFTKINRCRPNRCEYCLQSIHADHVCQKINLKENIDRLRKAALLLVDYLRPPYKNGHDNLEQRIKNLENALNGDL